MPDELVEHGGARMSGTGAWLFLFFTIMGAVIGAILLLDLANKALYGETTAETGMM